MLQNPGKFEGCPEFVVDFWELAMDGGADSDDGKRYEFKITVDDVTEHPGKLNVGDTLILWEDDQGFVHFEIEKRLTDTEIVKAIHQYLCEHWQGSEGQWYEADVKACDQIADLLTKNGYPVVSVAETNT
jgi:predicted GNAT family acetyltransferase